MELCKNGSNTAEERYICRLTQSYIYIEDYGKVKVYGISLCNSNAQKAMLDGEHCEIQDISCDKESVLRLVHLINECNVYPVHLKEIAEDFISQVQ